MRTRLRPRLFWVPIILLLALAFHAQAAETEGKKAAGTSLRELGKSFVKQVFSGPEPLPPDAGKLTIEEVILADVPTNVVITELRISPDQRRVAYIHKRAVGAVVIVNGKAGPLYDEVDSLKFSPDSRRFAHVAKKADRQFIVVDGAQGAPYSPWAEMYPVFSPDSKRVAYLARTTNAHFVVVDEVQSTPYAGIERKSIVFSPDSARHAFVAVLDGGKQMVVTDGKPGKPYEYISDAQFSPDSKRLMYAASDQEGSHVVVDEVAGPAFKTVLIGIEGQGGGFSADSQHTAYVGHYRSDSQVMVLDGRPGKVHEEIGLLTLIIGHSTNTAYVTKAGRQWCVVTNGVEGPLYDKMQWNPRFSPDGRRIVYVGRKDGAQVAVCDGQKSANYSFIGFPIFSPDSKRVAFPANKGIFEWVVLCDGQQVATNYSGDAWRTEIIFSPDSKRLAYRVSPADYVVVDGQHSRSYSMVMRGGPIFSPDSAHVAYWATAFKQWRVFVDASYSKEYDSAIGGSKLVFDSPSHLHALALRNRTVLLLEIRIGDD